MSNSDATSALPSVVLLQALMQTTPLAIVAMDRDGHVTTWNHGAERIFGWTEAEVIGRLLPTVPPEKLEESRSIRQLTLHGETISNLELRRRKKNGDWIDVSLSNAPLRDATGQIVGVLGVMADITEQKRTELALRESEELFRSLSSSTPLGIFLTDSTGACVYSNPQCRAIFGTTLMETLGTGWMKRIHPDDEPRIRTEWETGLRERRGQSSEFRLQIPGDEPIWVHLRTSPMFSEAGEWRGQVATIENINQRHLAQDRLQQSEERYRTLFETMREGFALHEIICDAHGQPCDYRFLEANSMFEEFTGLKRAELLGHTVREVIPDIEPFWITTYGKVALTGESTRFEHYVKALGRYYEVFAFSPKRNQFAVVFLDITQRKSAEAQLVETNQHLEKVLDELKATQTQIVQQERLSALGTMASGIAHDFNNALAVILGYSELLLHRPGVLADHDKATRYLKMMNTAAQDAGNVVNRLREFYRFRDAGEVFVPVDVNQLVTTAVGLTKPKWQAQAQASGRTIEVKTTLGTVPMVAGNEAELREALTNLIINAVDALPHGGTITLRTFTDGPLVCLAVSDTGTGMTEETRRRCLEPFFSTKGASGTGLGLSMVYGTVVQRHQGSIDIETAPGRGTTFIIKLPAADAATRPAVPPSTAAGPRSLRVLVVDDEQEVRHIVTEMLVSEGHTVVSAANGEQGLEEFQRSQFDVAIVDRAMPGISGDQFAAAIKSVAPAFPIILLTGFGALMTSQGEIPPGVDLVLSKPVTFAALRDAFAKVLAPPQNG